jgi:flagellar hook-length control protein FliK
VASHLTIISGTAGASASARAFAGQQSGAQDATSEPGGLLGLFAALLGNATAAPAATATPPAQTETGSDLDLAALFRLGLDSNFGETSEDDTSDPDPLAAAIDGPVLPTIATEPKPMVDFVEALGALKASIDKGEPLDPDLLAQVETALEGLAEALGLDIEELAIPEDFASLLETTSADETGLAGALTQLLAPLAQSLATAQPATDADTVAEASTASAQLKALGDKLASLLSALEEGKVSADKLAALGMTPGQPLDAEIEAALNRFAAGLNNQPATVPDEPVLATPTLKVTEPVLSGKLAETSQTVEPTERTPATAAPAEPTGTTPDQDRSTDQQTSDRGRERPEPASRDTRPGFTIAPAPTDASNTPSLSADAAAQQAAAARVDAAANPRIIQAGYQTSQQQLNLPQIAFELARQVQDGNTRFQIRLDPPELGRIDVRLEIDQSGQVNARLTVEKAETLDLMQRDQRGLERALQQAGLDGAKTNLEFSLKQNPFAGQQGQMGDGKEQGGAGTGSSANDNGGTAESEQVPPTVNLYRGALQASGVNIIA